MEPFIGKWDYTQGGIKKVLMTLGVELRSNPKIFDTLIGSYAKSPVAQALYLECFVDYDFLQVRHHKAIRAYSQNRKDDEAQLFSLCILFLHSFFLRDQPTCSDLIKKINAIGLSPNIHPYPAGRRMACNILFQAFYTGGIKESFTKEIFEYENQIPKQGPLGRNIPTYHTLVAEAFSWAGEYDKALSMIELAIKVYPVDINYHTQNLLGNLWIVYAGSLFKSGRAADSQLIYNEIDTAHFDVTNRNFSLMHYYKVGSDLQKQSNPKLAASLKRYALEIASNHKFKFFEPLYSQGLLVGKQNGQFY